jgi:SMC interacting uncharacterized protein involved in chromosome segregation
LRRVFEDDLASTRTALQEERAHVAEQLEAISARDAAVSASAAEVSRLERNQWMAQAQREALYRESQERAQRVSQLEGEVATQAKQLEKARAEGAQLTAALRTIEAMAAQIGELGQQNDTLRQALTKERSVSASVSLRKTRT